MSGEAHVVRLIRAGAALEAAFDNYVMAALRGNGGGWREDLEAARAEWNDAVLDAGWGDHPVIAARTALSAAPAGSTGGGDG